MVGFEISWGQTQRFGDRLNVGCKEKKELWIIYMILFNIFFKVDNIESLTIFLLFIFWIFGHGACRLLASQPGIQPVTFALKVKS